MPLWVPSSVQARTRYTYNLLDLWHIRTDMPKRLEFCGSSLKKAVSYVKRKTYDMPLQTSYFR